MPFFLIFDRKWPQNGWSRNPGRALLAPQVAPKTPQKRIRDATSIFYRFWIDLGSHFGDILVILAHF